MLELFARYLETERGNAPSTVSGTLSIMRNFYRFAEIDGYVAKSPAEHLRTPRLYRDESRTLGLDREEVLRLLQAAQESSPAHAGLIALMAMLGLRVTEACNVRIENFAQTERGHRVLQIVGKGNRPATIPLPYDVLRLLEDAAGDRKEGPLLLRNDVRPMNRAAAAWALEKLLNRAGINKEITPHSLRHAFVTMCLDAGVPLRDVQVAARHSDPRVTAGYDRARNNLDRHAVHTLVNFLDDKDDEIQSGEADEDLP
jgi:integrase/recombinase XerD